MKELKSVGKLMASIPRGLDSRAPRSNYLPFDVKLGPAKNYPDTKEGRGKMFDKLKKIRNDKNPFQGGLGE